MEVAGVVDAVMGGSVIQMWLSKATFLGHHAVVAVAVVHSSPVLEEVGLKAVVVTVAAEINSSSHSSSSSSSSSNRNNNKVNLVDPASSSSWVHQPVGLHNSSSSLEVNGSKGYATDAGR